MSSTHVTLGVDYELPEEEKTRVRDADAVYESLMERLNRQSVVKRFECYADIPWDEPEYAVDPRDPRFALPDDHPLGATDWYRSQTAETRALLGCHMIATAMKIGRQFEGILKQGMLRFAATLPDGSPEFRYCYHEIIEEAHHSLMFQEFVVRTGLPVRGLPPLLQVGGQLVAGLGTWFPELFLFFVLGGEDPIDYVQREMLKSDFRKDMHPLVRRISQIHITEEARHISFARAHLRRRVPHLGRLKRLRLEVGVPNILRRMAPLMMRPGPHLSRTYGIPPEVIREAYVENPEAARMPAEAVRKVRDLCTELELTHAPFDRIWKAAGLWAD
jgi:hypothetical protein